MHTEGMKMSQMGLIAKEPVDKKYIIYCDSCGKQKVDIGFNLKDMTQIPLSKIPGGVPKLSPEGKIENRPEINRSKMVKCPSCGRGIIVKKFAVKESIHKEEIKQENENIIKNNIIERREIGSTGSAISKYLAKYADPGCSEISE